MIIKGVPDGEIILSKPTPGAYAGMLVKVFTDKNSSEAQEKSSVKAAN